MHEQLAASMTRPAENLVACSTQIIPPFTDKGQLLRRPVEHSTPIRMTWSCCGRRCPTWPCRSTYSWTACGRLALIWASGSTDTAVATNGLAVPCSERARLRRTSA